MIYEDNPQSSRISKPFTSMYILHCWWCGGTKIENTSKKISLVDLSILNSGKKIKKQDQWGYVAFNERTPFSRNSTRLQAKSPVSYKTCINQLNEFFTELRADLSCCSESLIGSRLITSPKLKHILHFNLYLL
jgi:hypothetical protein